MAQEESLVLTGGFSRLGALNSAPLTAIGQSVVS
jgi:hypothetical protein